MTAFDVKLGKPHPEPYLMGLEKAGVKSHEAFVVENAPMGVRAGVAAGIFTIAVNTGPLDDRDFTRCRRRPALSQHDSFGGGLEQPDEYNQGLLNKLEMYQKNQVRVHPHTWFIFLIHLKTIQTTSYFT